MVVFSHCSQTGPSRENITAVVKLALKRAGIAESDIEHIAVTIGPGLAPALEVGIAFAKQLATRLKIPVVPVNHIEGHCLRFWHCRRQKYIC